MKYRNFMVGFPLDRPARRVLGDLAGLDGLVDLFFFTLRTEGRMGYVEGRCPESDWDVVVGFCARSSLDMWTEADG